jgi:hypothetical protein
LTKWGWEGLGSVENREKIQKKRAWKIGFRLFSFGFLFGL